MSFYKKLCKLYQSARDINLPAPHHNTRVIEMDQVPLMLENRERYIAQSRDKYGTLPSRQPINLYVQEGVEL